MAPAGNRTADRSSPFSTSGYAAARSGRQFPGLQALPPFLRVLLTTDGTVTRSLESYFWEPVAVELLDQRYRLLEADEPVIERLRGDRVLCREVQLRGAHSGRIYLFASSMICAERLPQAVRRNLEQGQVGIGELLRDLGLETYREIVELGEESSDGVARVWRIYRIVMEHRPLIRIKESFPRDVYAAP